MGRLTLAAPSPPYGAFSRAPLSAPSISPPRSSCLTWLPRLWTSAAETEGMDGDKEAVEKFAEDSGSRRSILIVRQFGLAILASSNGAVRNLQPRFHTRKKMTGLFAVTLEFVVLWLSRTYTGRLRFKAAKLNSTTTTN